MALVMQKMAPGLRLAPRVLMTSQRFSLTWLSYEGEALSPSWQHPFFKVPDLVFIRIEYNPIASVYHKVHLTLHIERALKMPTASALSSIINHFAQLSGHSSTTKNAHYPREGRTLLSSHLLFQPLWKAHCSGRHVQYLLGCTRNRDHPALCSSAAHKPQVTSTSWTLDSSIVHSRNWAPCCLHVQG